MIIFLVFSLVFLEFHLNILLEYYLFDNHVHLQDDKLMHFYIERIDLFVHI